MRNLTAADLLRLTHTESGKLLRNLTLDTDTGRIKGELSVPLPAKPDHWVPISWRLTGLHQLRLALSLDLTPLQ